jgi:hypothetical protein
VHRFARGDRPLGNSWADAGAAPAFAFDPERRAVILVAGDKSGVAQSRFYKGLVAKADRRFAEHLKTATER